jgi:hypothetical protein
MNIIHCKKCYSYLRGPFVKFVDSLLRVGTLWRWGDSLFFEVPLLASDALHTTLHPLLENVLQAILTSELPFFVVGKAQKSHGARYGLYGGCSNGLPPIWVSASIATFHSCNADAPLIFRHSKKSSFKTTVTPFSRSGRSVVRSASLAKGGTSKKRPSPHLHEVPIRSNNSVESTNFANGSHICVVFISNEVYFFSFFTAFSVSCT